jgi:NAD(P)-dependent dehydrogenase (short-subunit alcohol dehydrogenase family)
MIFALGSELDKMNYLDKFRLDNKTAVVTGGAGILGKSFCHGLANFGANVVAVDVNEKRVKEFAIDLDKQNKSKAIGIYCDVSNPESVKKMVAEVVAIFGSIEILHNNAGITSNTSSDPEAFFTPFEDYSLKAWREIMSVNIDGMFLVAQEVGKQMVKQGKGGSIIQTASIYGIMGPDQRIYEGSKYLGRKINAPAAYSTSKAAVVGLTKHLATYWANKKIRVNSLTPGGVESGQNEEFKRNYSQRIPLTRMAQSDEIVGALIYLASEASSYVTGQNIIVDGGLSAW